jgi:adenylate cyclase class 2
MTPDSNREIEIKLRLKDAAEGRQLLRRAGFRVAKRRVFEQNTLFDTLERSAGRSGIVLRLRTSGAHHILTLKGPSEPGKYKIREEFESEIADRQSVEQILSRLGYVPVFRYEKFRTEYQQPSSTGLATLDETPAGVFFELEGPADWIDQTAIALGFSEADFITASYVALHLQAHPNEPGDMVFEPSERLRLR